MRGRDIGIELHRRRAAKWTQIRGEFSDRPKELFGFKIYLNPDDLSDISSSIGTSGVLDLPLTCLLRKVLKPGMRVIDVGANIGYYTLLASQIVGSEGRVYAFEPESFNLGLLEKSVRENNQRNINIHKLAASDRNGPVRLYRADPSLPGAHSVATNRGHGFEDVISITLDDFWDRMGRPRIDFIKIHVAGDDPLVLRGSDKILREARPMITTVFDPPKWGGYDFLLRYLFDNYAVSEVVRSPLLLRRTTLTSLNRTKATELFLSPSSSGLS